MKQAVLNNFSKIIKTKAKEKMMTIKGYACQEKGGQLKSFEIAQNTNTILFYGDRFVFDLFASNFFQPSFACLQDT